MSRPERQGTTAPNSTVNVVDGRQCVESKATADLMALNRRISEAVTSRGTVKVRVVETGEERELWPVDCRQQLINGTVVLPERKT